MQIIFTVLMFTASTDQHGLILHHVVMKKQSDIEVAILLELQLKKNYWLESVSFIKTPCK